MSFPGTHTPKKGESKKAQRYTLPTRRGKNGATEFYLTPELEAEFRRLFPRTPNTDLMGLFGISFSTLQRFKRSLGLAKDMKVIRHKQAMQTKRICEKNGYYDSLRGKAPSPQCIAAYKRKVEEEGFSSIRALKENNPRGYRAYLKRKSAQRKEAWRKDKRRIAMGLDPLTKLHNPQFAYTKRQVCQRTSAKRRGYILGDMRESMGERYVIFYNGQTERSERFEQSLEKLGHFSVKPLPAERKPRRRPADMTRQPTTNL